jgi:hypothetical protein
MAGEPINILREAIRQVPSVKYALAVAGVAAAGALVVTLVGDQRATPIVLGGTFAYPGFTSNVSSMSRRKALLLFKFGEIRVSQYTARPGSIFLEASGRGTFFRSQ